MLVPHCAVFGESTTCRMWWLTLLGCLFATLLRCPLLLTLWPEPSAWRSCACGTAGGPRRRWGTAIGRESPACYISGTCQAAWPSVSVPQRSAAGTPCPLDSWSGPVRTPSGLGVYRQLGLRVFPDGRCCRWAGGRGVPASANRWSRRSGFPGLWCSILAGTGDFGVGLFALGGARQVEGELESSSFHPLRRGNQSTLCVATLWRIVERRRNIVYYYRAKALSGE